MSTKNDGGPAFPQFNSEGLRGMSLRDWFAGQALSAMLSMTETYVAVTSNKVTPDEIVGGCYQWADAMLAAREKDYQ